MKEDIKMKKLTEKELLEVSGGVTTSPVAIGS